MAAAAFSVIKEDATQETKIITIIALSSVSSAIPALWPTMITARVAAAWAELNPKIRLPWFLFILKVKRVASAAIYLPNMATKVSTVAVKIVAVPLVITEMSTIMPTLIRKKGINKRSEEHTS